MKKIFVVMVALSLLIIPIKTRAHGGIEKIYIIPLDQSVIAGADLTFKLLAEDNQGKSWDITDGATFQVNDPRGLFEKNVYRAGKKGTWQVIVNYGSFSAQTSVNVTPGNVAKIEVNPNSKPEVIILGKNLKFQAQAFDIMSNPLENAVFTWQVDENLGKIEKDGLFKPKDVGLGQVWARLGDVAGSTDIKVREETQVPEPESPVVVSQAASTTNQTSEEEKVKTEETEEQKIVEEGMVAGTEAQAAEVSPSTTCQTLAWYYWLLILIGFFGVLVYYYYLIRKSKNTWWWVFSLVFTVVIVWLYYQYSCNQYGWFIWFTIILAVLATLFRPKKFFEEPKENF